MADARAEELPDGRRANVVGLGLIGGSIGKALRARGWRVHGVDVDAGRIDQALAGAVIDAAGLDPTAEISFVAVPALAVADAVKETLEATSGLVTDVTGVKSSVVAAVTDPRFLGGHPMAGSEQEGLDGADPDLFEGAVWVLTPTAETSDALFATVASIVSSLGAEVVALTPSRHDSLVAVVSHVPHLAAATLMALADDRAEEHAALLRLAAGGFRDMTRIASGHPAIWPDICEENRVAIVDALDGLITGLDHIRAVVERGDRDALLAVLTRARRARANLPSRVARPADLAEVRIPIPDRPGAAAEVFTLAAELGVNVADFEVYHSAEGAKGIMIMLIEAANGELFRGGLIARVPAERATAGLTVPPAVATIEPIVGPLRATVVPPGSKSITNRALVAAALADGRSTIRGALVADDTTAMVECLQRLGIGVEVDGTTVVVDGAGGRIPAAAATLDVRQSGTTARFVAPVAALGHGRYVIDGAARMRERPMADLVGALRALGVQVTGERLPITIDGHGVAGGTAAVAANTSSQFASGLLLAAPVMTEGLRLQLTTASVSRPYLDLTVDVMRAFGAHATAGQRAFTVMPGGYQATEFDVEPDASAASYFFAAAAICGGRVKVPGLGRSSRQGDLRFVELLARMGATVEQTDDATTVVGAAALHGIEVDMADLSDTASTLAVVAAFASSPTRVTGIGFIRAKESDRVGGVVRELRRLGVDAEEEVDGFLVRPGSFRPARVHTYDDHRMAMSFALVGLRVPGVQIEDPGCVAKTFPDYFEVLAGLQVA